MSDPRNDPGPDHPGGRGDPRDEPIYRAVLAVLAASVVVGALVTLAGEPLFASPGLARAGLGMAVLCGVLYWVFRFLGRRAARRQDGGKD